MHVRVRLFGHPDFIISVDSKLTKIEDLRGLIEAKCKVESKHQRLFYGGKLLENGYTFHDYNIKLNDVIQLLAFTKSKEEKKDVKKSEDFCGKEEKIVYEDAKSNLYAVGDLIDMIEEELGAWFEGKIIGIVKDPNFVKPKNSNVDHTHENKSSISYKENQRDATENDNSKSTSSLEQNKISPKNKQKGITDYFSKEPKNSSKSAKSPEKKCENLKTDFGLLYKVHM
ncbi:E3 ubiquitin-protein ligase UHRF1 [Eumeta japonica]|uniref:E3 ubiquitin-protein ligase UHRF1 n=1 Tax=Eumeta variegata TaxID=151549 RepID=A0A4C1TQA8_EUMVA|nr:E3 ubiquitin-protein ligase UHRF1 [Eumeta japonica]